MQTITIQNQRIEPIVRSLMQILQKRIGQKGVYAATRTLSSLEKRLEELGELRMKILKEHAELDENDQIKTHQDGDEKGNVIFKDDEAKEKALEEIDELLEMDVKVEVYQTPLSSYELKGGAEWDFSSGLFYPLIVNDIITEG